MKIEIIERFIKRIIKLNSSHEEKTEELLFDLYNIVASHYHNRVPENIYNIFVSNYPPFKKYVDDIMMHLKDKKEKMNNEIEELLEENYDIKIKIREIENSKIFIKREKSISLSYEDYNEYSSLDIIRICKSSIPYRQIKIHAENTKIIYDKIYNVLENIQDVEEQKNALIKLFLEQVVENDGKRFIKSSIYRAFTNMCPHFEEYFNNDIQRKGELDNLRNILIENELIINGIKNERDWTREQIIEVIKG